MIQIYIERALSKAHYEIIQDDKPFYGEINELPGVWANGDTLEGCRNNLIEVLEGWLILRLKKNLEIPELDGIKFTEASKISIS